MNLWESPYTDPESKEAKIPQELIERTSQELGIEAEQASLLLEQLRQHTLQKLESNRRFRESGIATLNVQYVGQFMADSMNFQISIGLDSLASELREKVAKELQIGTGEFRLVAAGKILEDSRLLDSQGVTVSINVTVSYCRQGITVRLIAHSQDYFKGWREEGGRGRIGLTIFGHREVGLKFTGDLRRRACS